MSIGFTRRRAVPTLTAGVLAVLAGLFGGGTAHSQQAGQLYYYYQGEKKLLTPSADQLSVGLKTGQSMPSLAAIAPTLTGVEVDAAAIAGNVQRVTLRAAGAPPTPSGPTRLPRNLVLPAPGSPEAARSAAPSPEALKAQAAQRGQIVATARPQALQAYRGHPAVKYVYEALVHNQTGGLLYPTDRIIVKVKDGVSEADLRGKLPASLRELNPMLAAGQYLLELTDPKQDHPVVLAAQLQETAGAWLEWAEPDFIQTWLQSTPNANPNDPLFTDAANYQWHLNNLAPNTGIAQADARVQKAWTNSGIMGDGSVVIAVVDDGVQSTHPDLTVSNAARQNVCGKIGDVHGWNFVDDNSASDPVASPSHGTSVAGVAAATGNNTIPTGVTGACQNCPVVSARIFAGSTSTSASSIANAIAYAACTAEVINNSWGGGSESSAITAAVQNAIAGVGTVKRGTKGTPVLFATGNSGSGYNQIAITVQDPGTYTLEWRYEKDGSVASGYDTAWLDYVKFPTGVGTYTVESFEGNACASLPAGWTSTGNAAWVPVDAEVRAASLDGGHCSVKAGTIGDSESSGIKVTMTLVPGKLFFSAWVSSEPLGPIKTSGCYDKLSLYSNGSSTPVISLCGTYSNQGTPLAEGVITYPASIPGVIAVGAATNFDRRSDYSQWGPGLTLLAHSGGGTLDIATTDYTGPTGYSTDNTTSAIGDDYTDTFSGTSSATPLTAGIVALYLQQHPTVSAAAVKTALQAAVRPVGCETYTGGVGNGYGHGLLDAERLLTGATTTPGIEDPNPCPGGSNKASFDPNIAAGFLTGQKPAESNNTLKGGSSSDQGACLIAFLTHGWLPDAYLRPLRNMRGWLIAQGPWGRSLVRSYYRTSAVVIRWLAAPALGAAVLGAL